jgi:hypothetical protein
VCVRQWQRKHQLQAIRWPRKWRIDQTSSDEHTWYPALTHTQKKMKIIGSQPSSMKQNGFTGRGRRTSEVIRSCSETVEVIDVGVDSVTLTTTPAFPGFVPATSLMETASNAPYADNRCKEIKWHTTDAKIRDDLAFFC